MGYREYTFQLPTNYADEELRLRIQQELRSKDFSFTIDLKSLDARRKRNIHWLIRVGVSSPVIKGKKAPQKTRLLIPEKKTKEKAIVVGSGPAGFFAAYVLQKSGINTTLVDRGSKVRERSKAIRSFEATGVFSSNNNYAFGEGGAGTFSDGKLTSRTKRISLEKEFMLESYIKAGAPEEIRYMAHPHLGSDNLRKVVQELRKKFIKDGGRVYFDTMVDDISVQGGKAVSVETSAGAMSADHFVFAPGHSAYETYRMLMERGVQFRTKNFAIGARVEHPQALINKSQWGSPILPGVKAAEYRLTSTGGGKIPVYTFCMCPGGIVVPAAVYAQTSIVNGMSFYSRDGEFANAACVAGIDIEKLLGKRVSAAETLAWLESLEQAFYSFTKSYQAPAATIKDFVRGKSSGDVLPSSYPLGTVAAPLWELLPKKVTSAIRYGLRDFSRKLRGFETGNILGLESKTSAPIQALRNKTGLCEGFGNLYLVGEGSGYAGGIISSGSDGIRAAMSIIANY